MPNHLSSGVNRRKQPQQARSTELVAAILQAASQVLAEVGARRFTTARVAARAGVSVGSLYQYFPNKAAILFQLQSDEWRNTAALLQGILEDRSRSPTERLYAVVHAFVRTECEEAAVRVALGDAAPYYRDAPEAEESQAAGTQIFEAFVRDAIPTIAEVPCRVAADMIAGTLSTAGKRISGLAMSGSNDVLPYTDAVATMLSGYLESLRSQMDAAAKPGPNA